MHRRLWIAVLPLLLVLPFTDSHAQFDLQAFRDHLESIEELSAGEFLSAHEPFGPYRFEVGALDMEIAYLPELDEFLELTEGELDLLDRHGFVASERMSYEAYGDALFALWHADMPLFISTDLILHTLHRSYLEILYSLESEILIGELDSALAGMHAAWTALDTRYADNAGMRASLDDVDIHLTVARSLLAGETLSSMGGNDAVVGELLTMAAAEQLQSYPLFNETPRPIDFSQLEPRGHYTRSEPMKRYFRSMMWLGRTEMRLTIPPGDTAPASVDREIIGAFLVRELTLGEGVREHLDAIDRVVRALVGEQDNTTLDHLEKIYVDLGLNGCDDLLDLSTMDAFDAALLSGEYAAQAINSQILINDPLDPEPLDPPYAFLLLGQRFILDGYITWNVVYDRIPDNVFRGLPDPLDVLYVLGNDDVLPLLENELEAYGYAPNLSSLRYLVAGYEDDFWRDSLYAAWLKAISTVSLSGRQDGVPEFMRTGAWQQEKMNTQLASWAELRHDNLLYAKQPYTGGVSCSYPRVYLEPIPALYESLGEFAQVARAAFASLQLDGWVSQRVDDHFANMQESMEQLTIISAKELAAEALGPEELLFLESVLYDGGGCAPVETGWLRELYYEYGDMPASREDLIVADVHTQPTDANGNMVGHVLHAATGHPTMGVFIAARPGEGPTAFAGPVASYHEYISSGFERLTDEEWQTMHAAAAQERPDWSYVYLADRDGKIREGGRRLVRSGLGIEDPIEDPDPQSARRTLVSWVRNTPNPFNPRTLISFRLETPVDVEVRVDVVDGRGRLIRRLDQQLLGTNTYFVDWDGRDDSGGAVASGVYYARVVAGATAQSGKMTLLR